jgi:RNA polymerase sporulation-specific sigma factor
VIEGTARAVGDTDQEDAELVDRARAGDDAAIELLLNRYRHYARAKARSYFIAGADADDLVQEGMIGLYNAIRDFDRQHNTAFRAFAELCITRRIISAIKGATRQKHMPLNSYLSLDNHDAHDDHALPLSEALVSNIISDPADIVISAEEMESLRESMTRALTDLEAEVLDLYMDGSSYQEIAGRLGRHVKSIDNALQRIKRKMEQHLTEQTANKP